MKQFGVLIGSVHLRQLQGHIALEISQALSPTSQAQSDGARNKFRAVGVLLADCDLCEAHIAKYLSA